LRVPWLWERDRGEGTWLRDRAIGGSNLFLNYAVWESVAHFRAAFSHSEFKQALEKYPSSVVASPHLFSRVAVPNLCTVIQKLQFRFAG